MTQLISNPQLGHTAPLEFRPGVIRPDAARPRLEITRDMITMAAARVPAHPALRDWLQLGGPWGMLGNADWGDCVEAGIYHAVQALTGYTLGKPVIAGDGDAENWYSQLTGFDPNEGAPGENPTDRGTDPLDAFSWWRKRGITIRHADGTTETHKILAYAEIDYTDLELVAACINIFGVVFPTLQVPRFAMEQTNDNQPWDIVTDKSGRVIGDVTNLGGHFIMAGAYSGDRGSVGPDDIDGITWAIRQSVKPKFWHEYMDACYVVVPDRDWFLPTGDTPSGFDAHAFGQQFADLTGEANPWPNDTPTPEPTPGRTWDAVDSALFDVQDVWSQQVHVGSNRRAAAGFRTWLKGRDQG